MWHMNSVASFGSRCTIRSGSARSQSPPAPKSRSHGYDGGQPRCFSSRHVPSVAEEIVQNDCWTPSVKMRFNGLMKHLKTNSAFQDKQKEILFKEAAESFIPEEFDEALRGEFERRCAYGERMNTELMSSAKWVKLLQEVSIIPVSRGGSTNGASAAASRSGMSHSTAAAAVQARAQAQGEHGSSPLQSMTRAEADIIFHKVVHNCDHGAKRLTYELFCKALALTSHALWPDLEEEAAFSEILTKVISTAPEEDGASSSAARDCMLDANVLLVLDHFKPCLHELFGAFCHRNLSNPSSAGHGMGTVRMKERTIWKHTQDTIMASSMLGAEPTRLPGDVAGMQSSAISDCGDGALRDGTPGAAPESGCAPSPGPWLPIPGRTDGSGQLASPLRDCGGSSPLKAWMDVRPSGLSLAESLGMSPRSTMQSKSPKAQKKDPYLYANGAPVIRNRRQNMSCDQMITLCKELKVLPELLTRLEVVKVFKRAQCSGLHTLHGSSAHGYLSRELFVDAIGQLAIEAYSKEPFCDEYPEAHEKIYAFLLNHLPDKKRKVQTHDRFLYSRSG